MWLCRTAGSESDLLQSSDQSSVLGRSVSSGVVTTQSIYIII